MSAYQYKVIEGNPAGIARGNTLVFACPGAQSAGYVEKILEGMEVNFVVVDPGGEYYKAFADKLRLKDYIVKTLNLQHPGRSNTYNPMRWSIFGTEIEDMAEALIEATDVLPFVKTGMPWAKAEKALLVAIISYIRKHTVASAWNMESILRLLYTSIPGSNRTGTPLTTEIMSDVDEEKPCIDDKEGVYMDDLTVPQYKVFLAQSEEAQKEIALNLIDRLHMFEVNDYINLTKETDIGLNYITTMKAAIFIVTPPDTTIYNGLGSLLIWSICNRFETDPKALGYKPRPTIFLLDDFASMGAVKNLPEKMEKHEERLAFHIIAPGVEAVQKAYPVKWAKIVDSCDRIIKCEETKLSEETQKILDEIAEELKKV